MKLLASILSLPRFYKRMISVVADITFITISFFGALYIRLADSTVFFNEKYWLILFSLIACTLLIFIRVGLYRAILRFLSVHALFSVAISCFGSALFLVIIGFFVETAIPRSIPIIYCTLLIFLSGGARLFVRVFISKQNIKQKPKVLIYGAGDAGRQLVYLLRQGREYHPVAFIDDNKKINNTIVSGLTVYSPNALFKLIPNKGITKILLAIPSASRSDRKAIIGKLVDFPVEVKSIPHFEDIVNGSASVDQLRDVSIEELLGRDPVPAKPELLAKNIKDQIVMVTGAGGSIGSELCRQIIRQGPKTLVLFELSEFSLYKIEKELLQLVEELGLNINIVPLLGSVQRQRRILDVLKSMKIQTLYHAAAYKHVPLVELNVIEGIRNNIFGTYYTALAAIEAGVDSFVLISTDKAVRPTNVMGATKRMAELSLQALADSQNKTRFCMVRFGNVLGSSGSVIPLFKEQIEKGSFVTVTHPEITRYFMTIPEAAQLVIQAGAMGKGGDVFVLDMGEPVKIVDLAKNLIKLSGLDLKTDAEPLGDIEIRFTGLRPGEKLYEELLIGDNVDKTAHPLIMTANESFLDLDKYEEILNQLNDAAHKFDHKRLRQILLDTPTGFNPTDGICDLVYNAKIVNKEKVIS